jgi:hypothetical protein
MDTSVKPGDDFALYSVAVAAGRPGAGFMPVGPGRSPVNLGGFAGPGHRRISKIGQRVGHPRHHVEELRRGVA